MTRTVFSLMLPFALLVATAASAEEPAAPAPVEHPQQQIADELFKSGVHLEKTVNRDKSFTIYACLGKDHNNDTLKLLASLPNVTEVDAGGTKMTDEGAQWFLYMPNLRELHLYDTKITDATLLFLTQHKRLEVLDLSNTNVTDAGLLALAEMRNLRELKLNGTKVTDEGLAVLARLPRLERVWLQGTGVTPAAAQQLEQAGLTYLPYTPTYAVVRSRLKVFYDRK